ncbi:MAG: NADH-quinone oxidoreductase subunit NuoF [Clostridia bacterium]|nr:NADH-quinone oxidoreductase subunit NuoF [Clostridia bacterium]
MDIKELTRLKEENYERIKIRLEDGNFPQYQILICSSTGCHHSQNYGEILDTFHNLIKEHGLEEKVQLVKTGCFGLCAQGPIVLVYPGQVFYSKVKLGDVKDIIEQHIINGKPVERLLHKDGDKLVYKMKDLPYYKNQLFVARHNIGILDPDNIYDYIARDGYFALNKAVTTMTPDEVIDEVEKSGLRGRGGTGFPTGKKWRFARMYEGNEKFVICNGDEGDPGAFMDRSIVESDPHSVVEAMAIAGYAIGASRGIVYIRAEYPLAGARILTAIEQAKKIGVLGDNIFGTDFCFDIEIKYGAGAFVCGEETALIKSCEGGRGEPIKKPPFPAEHGYLNEPTIINNIETLANVAQIVLKGADWFTQIGSPTSKGTKVFALSGKIVNAGLVELPMGSTIEHIIYGVGGGIPNGKKFKAVQMGGPSGGCIPAEYINTEIDYQNLQALGSMMGSGGVIVMDEDTCMVNIAKFFLEFTCDESCGKCTPCRIGNKRLHELLTKICNGDGEMKDLDELESLSNYIKQNSMCGLGQSSPNPILSTLRYFRDEYIEHIKDHKCRAGVCKNMVSYVIDKNKCKGCSLCSRVCPASAISGELRKPYEIDPSKCVKCGKCFSSCKFNAIERK